MKKDCNKGCHAHRSTPCASGTSANAEKVGCATGSGASPSAISRRGLLAGTAAAGLVAYPFLRRALAQFTRPSLWHGDSCPVFVARQSAYDAQLVSKIRDGLLAVGIQPATIRNKKVLLKPNLVEPTREVPFLTTNPAMVVAAAEVFLDWGAEITIGEASGHIRDTQFALYESNFEEPLADAGLTFTDLNYESVQFQKNVAGASKLKGLFHPRSVIEADLVVSMPKLKSHHWVGMTSAMKNLYGVLPGIKYGWPKNVLHHAGIVKTVVDINASLPNTIAIVDGIDCMQGDGPMLGDFKHLGIIAVGVNLPALDATCARMIGLDPYRLGYLNLADGLLGPIDDHQIVQRGESWQSVASRFDIVDAPHLKNIALA